MDTTSPATTNPEGSPSAPSEGRGAGVMSVADVEAIEGSPLEGIQGEMMPAHPSAGGAGERDLSENSRWGVLRHPHFRTMWFAGFGSYVGGWLEFVAVRWIVSQETKSEDWMAYLAMAQLCPTLLLGMIGGHVADSVNRRRLLILTQLGMMVIALVMAAAAYFDFADRWVLLGLCLAQGIVTAFNAPAMQVLTPRLVPKSDLTRAITLNGISFNFARLVGPALAGAIMTAFSGNGAAAILLFNAGMFVVVMLAVLTTPDAPAPAHMLGKWKHPGEAWRRTLEAVGWVWTRKGPRAVLLALVVFGLLATPVMQLMPLVISEVYGKKEDTFGALLTVMGIGAVTGGIAIKYIPKWYPMHHLIPVSILGAGIWILVFSLVSNPTVGLVLMFFIGFFWMWGWNSSASAIQMLVDDQMRGRVSAVVNTIAMGLMPLGTVVASRAGHLGDLALGRFAPELRHSGSGTQMGLAFVSATLVIAALVMLIWRTPEVDGLKPGDPAFERKPGLLNGLTARSHRPARGGDGLRPPASGLG